MRPPGVTYQPNAIGGITSRTGDNAYQWSPIAPATNSYADNGLNQYTSVAGSSFTYDSRGNLTSDGTNSYTYDSYNRLLTAPGSTSLAYDPAGRLYESSVSGTATRFLYDGDEPIAEYDASAALLRRYVPGLVWYEGSGTTDRRYLIQDERGSVIAVDSGSGVSIYSYDEYGAPNAWSGPSSASRFRYAGAMMLASAQLYHMRARVYAPGIGRFLQTDPILFAGGMNLYAYTANDPVNFIDPSGLLVQSCGTGSILLCKRDSSGGFTPIGNLSCTGNCSIYTPQTGASSRTEGGNGGDPNSFEDFGEDASFCAANPANCVRVNAAVPIVVYVIIASVGAGIAWAMWFYDHMTNGAHDDDNAPTTPPTPPADTAGTPQGPDDPIFSGQSTADVLNKANHVFGPRNVGRHQLQGVLARYGGDPVRAYRALTAATNSQLRGASGIGMGTVRLAGQQITVRYFSNSSGRLTVTTAYIP